MRIRGRFGFVGLLWILIGIFVAWDHGYITVRLLKQIVSALLAVFLWILVLLGVDFHLS